MPANPYSSQTISGYNSSPPPDDGSQVTANKVTWNSTIKTKLADPLNTFAAAINSAVSSAFGLLVVTTVINEESLIVYTRNTRRM